MSPFMEQFIKLAQAYKAAAHGDTSAAALVALCSHVEGALTDALDTLPFTSTVQEARDAFLGHRGTR